MKILNVKQARDGSSSIAKFDLEINEQVRIFGLHLKRNGSGELRIFAPKSGGQHAASFGPEISAQITAAAIAAWEGKSRVECN